MLPAFLDSLNPLAGRLSRHSLVLRTLRMALVVAVTTIPVYGIVLARIDGVDSLAVRAFWIVFSVLMFVASYWSRWLQKHAGAVLGIYMTVLMIWLGILTLFNGLCGETALLFTFTFFSLGIVFAIAFETIRPLLIYIAIQTALAVALVVVTPSPSMDPLAFLLAFAVSALALVIEIYNRIHDRSELKATASLLTSAERLGEIGSWSYDLETGARQWSRGLYALVGVPPRNGKPPRLTDFVPEESLDHFGGQEEALMSGTVDDVQDRYRVVRTDGEIREMRSITQLARGDDGTPLRLVGAVLDITEQTRYERTLDKARQEAESAAALKTAILENMSHEIRTPLTAVIGFAQVLRDELSGEQLDLVRPIETGGKRLLATLDSVLDFARVEAGGIDQGGLTLDLVSEARLLLPLFQHHARAKGLGLHLAAPEAPVYARAAASGELNSALSHLVSNAIKFTSAGAVSLHIWEEDDHAVLVVRDTGDGMDEAFLPHLFEPFHQESSGDARRYEGPGLGLAIAHRLIVAMGGTIDVESTPGHGTAFTIRLVRAAAPEAARPVPHWVPPLASA